MPTPIEDHGGCIPSEFHTCTLPSIPNKLVLLVNVGMDRLNIELFKTLYMPCVEHVFYNVTDPTPYSHLPIHPLVTVCTISNTKEFVTKLAADSHSSFFFYEISNGSFVHPELWTLLKHAESNTSYTFVDSMKKVHTLSYVSETGIADKTVTTSTVAAYSAINQPVIHSIERGILRHAKQTLTQVIIDTSNLYTPLCYLATKYMTDKSPYNIMTHRHPYTAVYDMFLTPYMYKSNLKLGEVGTLNGSSIRMWRDYFPHAYLHGFDIEPSAIEKIKDIPGVKGHLVDASIGLRPVLQAECMGGSKFDLLFEDGSHRLDHQLLFIRDAIDYLNPGGMLIIEDIFREIPAARFEEALSLVSDKVKKALLVQPEHTFRHSPGWENDRLLIIWVV
jgi:hypothetical protein